MGHPLWQLNNIDQGSLNLSLAERVLWLSHSAKSARLVFHPVLNYPQMSDLHIIAQKTRKKMIFQKQKELTPFTLSSMPMQRFKQRKSSKAARAFSPSGTSRLGDAITLVVRGESPTWVTSSASFYRWDEC